MGCFDDYSDALPSSKTRKRNGITMFILHVVQCITFNQTQFVAAKITAKALLKSLYSRLGFKVTKDFATFTNSEKARKRFHYESGKYKELLK